MDYTHYRLRFSHSATPSMRFCGLYHASCIRAVQYLPFNRVQQRAYGMARRKRLACLLGYYGHVMRGSSLAFRPTESHVPSASKDLSICSHLILSKFRLVMLHLTLSKPTPRHSDGPVSADVKGKCHGGKRQRTCWRQMKCDRGGEAE